MIGLPTTVRSQTPARPMPVVSHSSPIISSTAPRTAAVSSAVPPGFIMA